jgi:hypothetical protein
VTRPALLVFSSLVLWGTLLLVVAAVDAFGEGLRPVVSRLLPSHGASLWAWVNAAAAALAAVVWALVAGATALRLRSGGSRPAD